MYVAAARGFDNNLLFRCPDRFAASGEADVLRINGNVFRFDIANGNPIFSLIMSQFASQNKRSGTIDAKQHPITITNI